MANDEKSEIQEKLIVGLAEAVLSNSLSGRDNLVKVLTTIAAVSIPAYVSLLKLYSSDVAQIALYIKVIPVVLLVAALVSCFIIMFPRRTFFNFKEPGQIIANHYELLKSLRKYAIAACILESVAMMIAAGIFTI